MNSLQSSLAIAACVPAVTVASAFALVKWGHHFVTAYPLLQAMPFSQIGIFSGTFALTGIAGDCSIQLFLKKVYNIDNPTTLTLAGASAGIATSVGSSALVLHFNLIPLALAPANVLMGFGTAIFLIYKIARPCLNFPIEPSLVPLPLPDGQPIPIPPDLPDARPPNLPDARPIPIPPNLPPPPLHRPEGQGVNRFGGVLLPGLGGQNQ